MSTKKKINVLHDRLSTLEADLEKTHFLLLQRIIEIKSDIKKLEQEDKDAT